MPGQWWHDLVRRAMSPEMAADWLADSFELSELHVLPEYQGGGIGRELCWDLRRPSHTERYCCRRPTPTRAHSACIAASGFVDLARHYLFPGDARPFAVLGARLPLGAPEASA